MTSAKEFGEQLFALVERINRGHKCLRKCKHEYTQRNNSKQSGSQGGRGQGALFPSTSLTSVPSNEVYDLRPLKQFRALLKRF